ncbi:fumarylacetoacetate hydrolase family protein [Salinirubellus sp. GCM10025818]|jgi:2-keto-4-pentenoate hydratase/2-oxohepta-3-ene-1,7-dioic acid hydratase in catechol pathway|uniref:fumarylacetoacetate hydrolase family protein n=1 Tax=Salinirubellus TaxID=2162630 RepID=UPI0030CBB817
MHRVRFRDPAGSVRTGEWHGDEVSFAGRTYDLEEVDVLPPSDPTKILCIGLNYAAHAEESGSEIPDRPLIFMKGLNALAGHGDTVPLLSGKERIDYEAELGVVIGEQCRHVSQDDAMDVVEGFTCFNDVSNRDDQRQEQNWIRGKAFDNSAPVGPVLATPDEVPDDAYVRSRVNGELRQDSSRDDFIFTIPELIEEITTYVTLEPGDIIATGTPEGVGPLSDGDTVEVEVEGVGTLVNDVADE